MISTSCICKHMHTCAHVYHHMHALTCKVAHTHHTRTHTLKWSLWVSHRFLEGVVVNWCVCCTAMNSAPIHSTVWRQCSCPVRSPWIPHTAHQQQLDGGLSRHWSNDSAAIPSQHGGFWAALARACRWFKAEDISIWNIHTSISRIQGNLGKSVADTFKVCCGRHFFPGWGFWLPASPDSQALVSCWPIVL